MNLRSQRTTISLRSTVPASRRTTGQVPSSAIVQSSLFRRGTRSHLACWNVRTLCDEGAQCMTMRTMSTYGAHVVCLSKVRHWRTFPPQRTGSLRPQTKEPGRDDDRDSLGTGPSNLGSGSSGRGCSHGCRRNRSQPNAVPSNK